MKKIVLLVPCIFFLSIGHSQDTRLAEQYFQDGEYEKAGILFQRLLEQNKGNPHFFNRLTESLIYQDKIEDAESLVKKQLKAFPDEPGNYLVYGNLLEKKGMPEQAAEQFKKSIDKLPNDRSKITSLAGAYINQSKYDLAIAAYEKGMKAFNDKNMFPYLIADMYRRKGDMPKMISYYLISLDADPQRAITIQSMFQRSFQPADYTELQKQLYSLIPQSPQSVHYPEMLQWALLQSKDYIGALRQARALDIMLNENGSRIYQIGQIAQSGKEWDAAIKAFEYIIKDKGPQNSFYIESKKESLACKRNKIRLSTSPNTKAELTSLEQDYETFLNEFGKNRLSGPLIIE